MTAWNLWSLLSGILMLILGLFCAFSPESALMTLVMWIALVFIVVGAVGIWRYTRDYERKWYALIPPILDVIFGVVLLTNNLLPYLTLALLPIMMACWALIKGISQIISAFRFKNVFRAWWLPLIMGAISVVFAIILFLNPLESMVTLTVVLGIYFAIAGIMDILSSFRK
jgi:uncharacterized membrane protein HdeD (DUF308 family)